MINFVRYTSNSRSYYGILEGERVTELEGGLFEPPSRTGLVRALGEVKLLAPCSPSKILAFGRKYKTHLSCPI